MSSIDLYFPLWLTHIYARAHRDADKEETWAAHSLDRLIEPGIFVYSRSFQTFGFINSHCFGFFFEVLPRFLFTCVMFLLTLLETEIEKN